MSPSTGLGTPAGTDAATGTTGSEGLGEPSGGPGTPPVVVAVVTVSAASRGRGTVLPVQRGPAQEPIPAAALAAVAGQVRPVDRIVAVPVAGPSPAGAIVQALRHGGAAPPDSGFIWLLDESTRPEPDALDRLLACAVLDPGAAVLGPVGVTVDRAGRRRPAPGDAFAVRDVLAVERTGALVRAHAWRLLDGPNPLAGRADDLDLCWRAWRAGMRVVAVPSARLLPPAPAIPPAPPVARAAAPAPDGFDGFHGAAGPPARARGDHVERADALRVRLAQSGALGVPAAVAGLVAAACGRAALALAHGRGRAAVTEVLVLASVLADPVRLWRLARRREARQVPARALRGLLPRPGEDGRTGGAETRPAGMSLAGARLAGTDPGGRDPRPAAADRAPGQPAVLFALLAVAAGWALTGMGRIGGRGAPLPPGAADLWTAVWSGWVGPAGGLPGGPGPAPSWTPLLATLSSALGGRPELAARALLVAAPALAGLAAYRAARTVGVLTPWARLGLAACYAFAPPVTAAALAGNLAALGASVAAPLILGGAVRLLAPSYGAAAASGTRNAGGAAGGWSGVWALAAALLVGVACSPRLLVVAAVGLVAGALAARPPAAAAGGRGPMAVGATTVGATAGGATTGGAHRAWRPAGRVAVVVAAGCVPLLPALWVGTRTGTVGALSVLVDEPAPRGGDGYALAAFVLVCGLAAVAGGRPARPAVGACWLVAAAGWVTGQDGLTAAALLGAVAAAWAVFLGPRTRRMAAQAAGAAPAGRLAGSRAAAFTALVVLAPALLFARAAGALGTPPDPGGWVDAGATGQVGALAASGDAMAAAAAGAGRTLVLRPSASGVTYTLTGGHGPTIVDAAGGPSRPAAEFLAAVVADLTVGGGWGASALPALGAGAVFVPAGAAASTDTAQAYGPAGATSRLTQALDASDGLERDQTRPTGYYWRLAPGVGAAARARLLPPGLAVTARSGTAGPSGRQALGSVAAARAAAAGRAAMGPGAPLAPARPEVTTGAPAASSGTSSDGLLPAGPAGRLLVLAEPADPGWRATLAGRPLTPVAAWGWAQAFEVPGSPAAEVRVRYDHTPHRALVLVEAAVVGALALAGVSTWAGAWWRRRRGGAAVWWGSR
ncbi:glycosyltransferase [Pseudofrankia sp. EUN1h]|uniref:glycosyltransferase n=3 Tax=Pseudofrankia TaxID=2994363 RepID=UPI0013016293|nr:glycosyltransferase [Pseudofrankia sp. EUN1h]